MYAVNWVRKMAHEQIHSVEPEQEAIDDFNVHTQEFLKRTVHTSHCRSRYKNNKVDGPVAAMWAGLPMQFKDMMSVQRGVDFDIKYCSPNRFRFFRNGTSGRDAKDNGSELLSEKGRLEPGAGKIRMTTLKSLIAVVQHVAPSLTPTKNSTFQYSGRKQRPACLNLTARWLTLNELFTIARLDLSTWAASTYL